jgi:hypothetical protein
MIIANTREHGGSEPQAGRAKRDIARRAAKIFAEAMAVFQAGARLLRIKINRQTPQTDKV